MGEPPEYYLGFKTAAHEVESCELSIEGKVPKWLSGVLLRNGPGCFETETQPLNHWLDGFALLHRFGFDNGAVNYCSRYLLSRAYGAAQRRGKIRYREFATDPSFGLVRRVVNLFRPRITDNANINIEWFHGHCAAVTGTSLGVLFDPRTLQTLGLDERETSVNVDLMSPLPQHDSVSGDTYNVGVKLGRPSHYCIWRTDLVQQTGLLASYPVEQPSYVQSFGLTENYIILVDQPFRLTPSLSAMAKRPYIENYSWREGQPSRFLVFDRRSGKLCHELESEPFFTLHHVNAFEEGSTLLLDLVTYDDAKILDAFYLDRLRDNATHHFPSGSLRRFSLYPKKQQVITQDLYRGSVELPRINNALVNTQAYRYCYAVASQSSSTFFHQLVKIDVNTHAVKTWEETHCYPGEPVFVPRPESAAEDDGVILSVVLDARRKRSFLLVLHASSFQELARVHVPIAIPFGLHGQFFDEEALDSMACEAVAVESLSSELLEDKVLEPSPSRQGELG